MQSFSTHGKRLAKYTSKFFGKYYRISFLEQKILSISALGNCLPECNSKNQNGHCMRQIYGAIEAIAITKQNSYSIVVNSSKKIMRKI